MEESSPSLRNNLFVCLDKDEKFIQLTAREREPGFCLSLKDLETHSFFIFFQASYWRRFQRDLSEIAPVPFSQQFSREAEQTQSDFSPGFSSLPLDQHQYGGRWLCQRSSPEAVLIQHLGSCQRKQRGEKQQKVAPCSSSAEHVRAEQSIAPRQVFSPFSTQRQKL